METKVKDEWQIPPKLELDRGAVNPFLIYFNVWWPSIILSFVAWVVVVRVWASEDTFGSVLSFSMTIASVMGIAYSFLLLFFGLPLFVLAYIKPRSVLWKNYCVLPITIMLSLLSVELLGYLMIQQSVSRSAAVFPLIGLGYGLITGVTFITRKSKFLAGRNQL